MNSDPNMPAELSLQILKLSDDEKFFLVHKLEGCLIDNREQIEKSPAAVKSLKYIRKQLFLNRLNVFLTKLES